MTAPARAIYSSASDNWPIPHEFYDRLDSEFGFTLDVCASVANHKVPEFYALDHPDVDRRDGLARDWAADARDGAVWMNPPYGRGIATWMTKAQQAAATGATVVCLVPVRADASWWHEHVLTAGAEVRYVRGRLTFGGAAHAAPFASAVVIYRPSDVRDTAGPVATVPARTPAPETLPGHASPDTTVEEATADLLASYTPQALTAEQWATAGDAVRTLIVTARPTAFGVARSLLSVVTGLLAHTDAWDKTNAPRWSDILTDAVIDRYVTSHQRGATRGVFRSELRQLARAAGTIPRRAHTPCIRPVDPTLLAAATQPIPVAAYPALWTAAHGTRMPGEKLLPVVAELARQAKQAKATARTRHTITVWSLPAPIRELAEANDQPVRETVTSTGGTTTRATRPLSRRAVKAHAHAQRAAREARTGTGTIPTAPAIDAPIQATIDAYRPWLKVRGTWDANRDVAHRLVTGFKPASARNAQHACSYIAKFLHWYAGHAGRNPQLPITLEELTKPGLVDAYITAYTGTDKSKATMRSALRRALGSLTPAGRSPILPGGIVSPPYTPAECAALVRLARHQPTPTLTAGMSFIVGLGLGAGLDSRDMRHLTRNDFADVHLDSSGPVLTVTVEHGDRPRTVPVRHTYADLVRRALELHEATGKRADALLLGHTAGRNNVAGNSLAEAKTVDPNGVQLTVTRLRNTWLVAVMSSPLPLADVLRAAGLISGRTITDLLPYCPVTPAADAERILAGLTPDAGDAP